MSLRTLLVVSAAGFMAAAGTSHAQVTGNATRGKAYAEQLCSDCHRTGREGPASADPKAPPFTAVAKTRGMSAMALGVWLQTTHPTMPSILLKPATMDDIIAYILSLREAP